MRVSRENMSTETTIDKHAIHDKLEAQIKTLEAKLERLKAHAETAKASIEIKAISDLRAKKHEMHQNLHDLKELGEDKWERAKTALEARIGTFEKSVHAIELKFKAH